MVDRRYAELHTSTGSTPLSAPVGHPSIRLTRGATIGMDETNTSEWAINPSDFTHSPILVPGTTGRACHAKHEFGWLCSRNVGHRLRHAAFLSTGDVVAVWHADH